MCEAIVQDSLEPFARRLCLEGMGHVFLNWAKARLDAVRTGLWLVPLVLFCLGVALALVMLRLDRAYRVADGAPVWLISGSGDDARNLLSTLLTAVISLAGIVFSITVVALSLAASAYGPRLVRIFQASRVTQLALGAFAMTIVYLLLVLRAVRGEADSGEVQHLSVAAGSLLALVCVLTLVWFIQSVSSLLVADEVVRRVRRVFDQAVDDLPRISKVLPPEDLDYPIDLEGRGERIRLPKEGYIQSVDFHQIQAWAEAHGAVVQLDFKPGDFVVDGDHKVHIYPAPADPEQARRQIGKFIVSGPHRTPDQDFEFAIRHLVEVAVRALSPGINDPYTAMAVVDRLQGGLARLAGRRLPAEKMHSNEGVLRVVRRVSAFSGIVDSAFDQIRQAAAGKPSVLIHMLRALSGLAEHLVNGDQRLVLRRHAGLIRAAMGGAADANDVQDADREYRRALSALADPAD